LNHNKNVRVRQTKEKGGRTKEKKERFNRKMMMMMMMMERIERDERDPKKGRLGVHIVNAGVGNEGRQIKKKRGSRSAMSRDEELRGPCFSSK
jgi:hypothetical protein